MFHQSNDWQNRCLCETCGLAGCRFVEVENGHEGLFQQADSPLPCCQTAFAMSRCLATKPGKSIDFRLPFTYL